MLSVVGSLLCSLKGGVIGLHIFIYAALVVQGLMIVQQFCKAHSAFKFVVPTD